MKKLVTLLAIAVAVCARSQIIFPDQIDAIRNSYGYPEQYNASGIPTFYPGSPVSSSAFGSPPAYSVAADDEGVIPVEYIQGGANKPFEVQSADAEAKHWSNHVNNLLARGVTKFTFDMNRAISRSLEADNNSRTKPNVVFSPLSLVSTLAMVLLGSAGVTFDQVAKILGLESGVDISSHSEIVHHMLGLLFKSIDAKPGSLGPQVTMASGIFVQNGYPIREEFKAISQQAYNNEVINLDFAGNPGHATKSVNDWVNARTRGKINKILEDSLDPQTRVIIASALYFSGEWNKYFFPRSTRRKPFAVTPNESVEVDMMYNGGTFAFYEDKRLGAKIIALPYKGNTSLQEEAPLAAYEATMYVVLPTAKNANALKNLENRLTVDNLEAMISQMTNEICVLGMPRMKLSSTLNLNRALSSLGLSSLFDPRTANLGLLSPGYGVTGRPGIFTRSGEDKEDPSGTTSVPKTDDHNGDTAPKNGAEKKKRDHFRYVDERGGYKVEQWRSGVLIEKIPRGSRGKRSSEPRKTSRNSMKASAYSAPAEHKDGEKVRYVPVEENKYRFETRAKRQSRPIDQEFVRFIESRGTFPNYGLDELRNSPNLGNPGLFAADVIHKVEMDVTETGTVAAAATSTLIQRGGDIKRLLADRPFLFFIRHERSKLMLFWGTVNKPTPSY